LIWCALMFLERSTLVHQGSYAAMLVAFTLFSAWCERAGAWTFGLLALLQGASFLTTWTAPTPVLRDPLNVTALAGALAGAILIVVCVVREHQKGTT
jgi:hypothetical protein